MPDQHKAESAIVSPNPENAKKISQILLAFAKANELQGNRAAKAFVGGFELALSLAVDHPEAVRDVLTTVNNARQKAGETGQPGVGTEDDFAARADSAAMIAEAAAGDDPEAIARRRTEQDNSGPDLRWN